MNDDQRPGKRMLDLTTTPFSRRGSYVAISRLPAADGRPAGLYLRSLRGPLVGHNLWQPIFHIQLIREGEPVPFQESATPTALHLQSGHGQATIFMPAPEVVRFRLRDLSVRLEMRGSMYDYATPSGDNGWRVVICNEYETKLLFTPLIGQMRVETAWRQVRADSIVIELTPDRESGAGDFAMEEFTVVEQAREHRPAADALRAVERERQAWLASMPPLPDRYAAAGRDAAHINWSCIVAPSGSITRPAVYMSKGRMVSIWSWDNCFNAVALAPGQPTLAWDQFMIMVDHQDASGAFPDLVNDRLISWSFCKPPVQGWMLQRMARVPRMLTRERIEEAYAPLCRWTDWWFAYRDDDQDGVPQYNHGNESGWDNSTVFATLPPIESPDLSAWLVLQMEALAEMAERLGRDSEALAWEGRSRRLLAQMLDHFWREDHFVARRSGSHEIIESHSLLLYMPIILGKRLPAAVQAALLAGIQADRGFLTDFGPATERVSSPHLTADGYWRGPIWGASTLLLVDGLRDLGEERLADDISRRFCDMVAENGIAENYDPLTGQGLCERAFTWTASAFLILARDLSSEPASVFQPQHD